MDEGQVPVLVGCGQLTEKRDDGEGQLPTELMASAAREAAVDAGPADALLQSLNTIVSVGLTVDAIAASNPLAGLFRNVPKTVAELLNIEPREYYYCATGGNTPQMLVNHFAEKIAEGETESVLLCGAEALRTMTQRSKLQLPLDSWHDDPGGIPTPIGDSRPPTTDHETSFGLLTPANCYPLFENALRGKYQRSIAEHQLAMGSIYQSLSEKAAQNPLAWFQQAHTAEHISQAREDNRYIAFPYTKLLNSIIQVNQAASVILTSEAKAKELGIDPDKWVYLHGCADAQDQWHLSERVNYHSSPALKKISQVACSMAGKEIADMDFLDIYSCFPSALEIACDEFGIAHDDERGLTLTGGLPYFGGPGNNYGMHAIAEMMAALRNKPGAYGMVNGNGWFVTKHSLGIYSTTPFEGDWRRPPNAPYQDEILQQKGPDFTEAPNGAATVETFTVVHDRAGMPEHSIVIGRLQDQSRFIATTPRDSEIFSLLMSDEALGSAGTVSTESGTNVFKPT